MSVENIGMAAYAMAAYNPEKAKKDTAGDFAHKMSEKAQADGVSQATALHGDDKETGDVALTSRIDYVNGVSMAVYRTKDFDPENPVYKVKMWDEAGNITERMVDISKVDATNCDTVEMYAYTAHLSAAGKGDFKETVLKFAVARAAKDLESKTSGMENLTQKVNWLDIVDDMMQSCYASGDLEGYMKWKKFFALLEETKKRQDAGAGVRTAPVADIRDRREQAFDQIAAHAPKSVKQAWLDRIQNSPFNPYADAAVGRPSRASMERAKGQRVYTVYIKTDDMIYSGGNGSGLSFYIKYAEDSTEEDPTVIAKGVDEYGEEFEQIIHINKINPRNATLVEMRALEAHLGVDKNGGISSLPMNPSGGSMGLHDRADFMEMFEQQIKDMKILGQKRLADYYMYSMRMYSDFIMGKISNQGNDRDWRA